MLGALLLLSFLNSAVASLNPYPSCNNKCDVGHLNTSWLTWGTYSACLLAIGR